MKVTMKSLLGAAACSLALAATAQELPMVKQSLPNPDNEPAPCHPLPSDRQLKWQEMEFYAFFHYGMNTYTNLEWGMGDEDVNIFAPTAPPNPRQWLEAVKAAGMKGGIAVVKHHDGFCLWPTQTTDHNCTNSSNPNGHNTNIPRDFAQAARDLDMKYGFYISPWDRNSALYGTDRYVKDVFMKQCDEIAQYGDDQFEMWFDGANGGNGYYGGDGGVRSVDASIYYDIPNLRDYIHGVAPDCVMWGVGEEARWIGNEAGFAGETNWCMVDRGNHSEASNRNSGQEYGWIWLPGESDAKATSAGWFWHPGQKDLTPDRLFQMYLETVGRNANLILNIPPDRAGLIPDSSVTTLRELGSLLKSRLSNDLAPAAKISANDVRTAGANRNYAAANLIDGSNDTYWAANDGTTKPVITLEWEQPQQMRYLQLMEPIAKGQRIKRFEIETSNDGVNWTRQGGDIVTSTVGYKRIIPLNGSTAKSYEGDPVTAKYLRVKILDSRATPLLQSISVF